MGKLNLPMFAVIWIGPAAEFKAKATRHSEHPDYLTVKIDEEITLQFYGFPTDVSYQCEKKCVAVLPNGKKIELNEIPIEA